MSKEAEDIVKQWEEIQNLEKMLNTLKKHQTSKKVKPKVKPKGKPKKK